MRIELLEIASGVLLLLSLVGAAYSLLGAREVGRFERRPSSRATARPPVTLLKPLSGGETGLYQNLRSFCETGYGPVQVVFGVRDPKDPAAAVVVRLQQELKEQDLTLVVDERVRGENLKVSNLLNMIGAARHDVVVISDSDVRVGSGYLEAAVEPLRDPSVGLVTCLYAARPEGGLWSRLGALWVNCDFFPSVLVAERLRAQPGAFGATLAMRRDTLEEIGGLSQLRDLLADDYALGRAVRKVGKRVVLSSYVVDMVVDEPTASTMLGHELRWLRTIRSVEPAGYAGLIVTHPVASALVALPLAGFSPLACAVLALGLGSRLLLVARVSRSLRLERPPIWELLLGELLSFSLFLAGLVGTRVGWRGRWFRIQPDGTLAHDGGPRS